MKAFVARHGEQIIGALSGLDRVIFRGTLRQLAHVAGLASFLNYRRILLKDFAAHAEELTRQSRQATEQIAAAHGRPLRYLESSQLRKENLAKAIRLDRPIEQGLICILSCVEPCRSYHVSRNRERKRIELGSAIRKCLHYYHYYLDPTCGFMHVRVQTWFPFMVQVYLNGREWLCRQLDARGVAYERGDNTLRWVEDFARAQRCLSEQLRVSGPRELERVLRLAHPLHRRLFPESNLRYYWSVFEREWAADLAFDHPASVAAIYPPLTGGAIRHFGAGDVMRFLGGKISGRFTGQIVSDFKDRPEGVRVKHGVGRNSVKVSDKEGSVLRVETTINQPRELKAYRRPEGNPRGKLCWRRLRKGVADMARLAAIAPAANERYYDALASLEERLPLHRVVDRVCRPTTLQGRRVRALQPFSPADSSLLKAINRGEFVVSGFRNRDLRAHLDLPAPRTAEQPRRNAASVGRLLRILRAHRLIKKVPKTTRYQVTKNGRRIIVAILAAHEANVADLEKVAA